MNPWVLDCERICHYYVIMFFAGRRADASQQKTFAWPLYLKYIYVFVQCN